MDLEFAGVGLRWHNRRSFIGSVTEFGQEVVLERNAEIVAFTFLIILVSSVTARCLL